MPLYIAPDIFDPEATEYRVFRDEWRNPYGPYPFACVDSSAAQFENWYIDGLVKTAGLRSVYVDCAKAFPCGNGLHGDGYKDADGTLHLTTPTLALRRYLRNLYCSLHNSTPIPGVTPLLIIHVSGGMTTVADDFSDIALEGEEVQYQIAHTPSYFDLYPPEKWRAIFGHQSGINSTLLPNYGRIGPKEDRMSEAMNATYMTQILLNDTSLWNLWTDTDWVNGIFSSIDRLGFTDPSTAFLPYWKQDLVSFENGELHASVYHTTQGFLVAVGNFSKLPQSGRMNINWKATGLSPDQAAATSVMTNKAMDPAALDVTVPPENFTLVFLKSRTSSAAASTR
jgi:hypothetical protein